MKNSIFAAHNIPKNRNKKNTTMKKTTLFIALVLLFGAKVFAQEWEYNESYFYNTGDTVANWNDIWQRPDGVCVVAGLHLVH